MTDHIPIETHPLQPWLPQHARILMCGTFPPGRHRWRMEFYYPNFINDMWRVFGLILVGDKDYFIDTARSSFKIDSIKAMLDTLGIALSDTGYKIRRLKDNASDKFLEIIAPINLEKTFGQLPECKAIVTTGEKAASIIAQLTNTDIPRTGTSLVIPAGHIEGVERSICHYRMPSTSRAYPLQLSAKAAMYARMLLEQNLLPHPTYPEASIPTINK